MTPKKSKNPKGMIASALAVLAFISTLIRRPQGVAFVNERIPDKQWVQIAPFGDYPNASGMQRFQPADGHNIVNEFHSLMNLPQRALGLPWYIGHPDYPAMQDRYTDTKAYGRIKDVSLREDSNCADCRAVIARATAKPCQRHGLFANVEWNEGGKGLISSQAFHGHSINWRMRKEGNVWRPFSMKSVGFTNEPQLPVLPVTAVNEEQNVIDAITFVNESRPMKKLTDYIHDLLGRKPEEGPMTEEDIVNAMDKRETGYKNMANEFDLFKKKTEAAAKPHEADCTCDKCEKEGEAEAAKTKMAANEATVRAALQAAGITIPDGDVFTFFVNEFTTARTAVTTATTKVTELEAQFANERNTLAGKVTAAETRATTAEGKIQTAETNFVNERKERAKLVIQAGITRGSITAAEVPTWEAEFVNEAKFTEALDRFGKLPKKMKTESQVNTAGLGKRNAEERDRQTLVQDAVNEIMTRDKCPYDEAWAKCKKEKSALFEGMKTPEKQGVS